MIYISTLNLSYYIATLLAPQMQYIWVTIKVSMQSNNLTYYLIVVFFVIWDWSWWCISENSPTSVDSEVYEISTMAEAEK